MVSSGTTTRHPFEDTAPTAQQVDERQRREEHILDTAAALLVRWGFRKTTVDDVAREAGVAKGTIYLHWKDKHELFRAALMRAQEQANAEMRQRIAADPEGGLPHRLWTHGMLAALANPLMAAVLKGQHRPLPGAAAAPSSRRPCNRCWAITRPISSSCNRPG